MSVADYRCPTCGRDWWPSMNESESYPGSACDTGGCHCPWCDDESEDDCWLHRPKQLPPMEFDE